MRWCWSWSWSCLLYQQSRAEESRRRVEQIRVKTLLSRAQYQHQYQCHTSFDRLHCIALQSASSEKKFGSIALLSTHCKWCLYIQQHTVQYSRLQQQQMPLELRNITPTVQYSTVLYATARVDFSVYIGVDWSGVQYAADVKWKALAGWAVFYRFLRAELDGDKKVLLYSALLLLWRSILQCTTRQEDTAIQWIHAGMI